LERESLHIRLQYESFCYKDASVDTMENYGDLVISSFWVHVYTDGLLSCFEITSATSYFIS
jgi:hypothetical protein